MTNEQMLLSLGNWRVFLHANVPDSTIALRDFCTRFQAFIINQYENSDVVVERLFVVSSQGLHEPDTLTWSPEFIDIPEQKLRKLIQIVNKQFRPSVTAESIDKPVLYFWSRYGDTKSENSLPRFERQENDRIIVLTLSKIDDFAYLKIFECTLLLANQWHLDRGGLCLHSAAVARRKDGFIFLGPSEAGKSTVSRLSVENGYPALGDDLNFILKGEQYNYYLAASPSPIVSEVGYSTHRPPLKGIFRLVQDKQDSLISLQSMQVAKILFNEFLKETPYVRKLPDRYIRKGFQICCDIARCIPGYELHFRKSPDFWKLINAEFGLD